MRDELEKLARDLYQEGYQCGITEDTWFEAWALAMERVASGEVYAEDLVVECYHKIREGVGCF